MVGLNISKDTFRLSRLEILIMISIAMSGVTMYYVGSLVEPLKVLQGEEVRAGAIRTQQLDRLNTLVAANGNLTQQNREGLIKAINDTYYVTIPAIRDALEQLKRESPSGNFTGQKMAFETIGNISRDTGEIKNTLQNSSLS